MVKIEFIITTEKFERDIRRIKDKRLKRGLEKQIRKIVDKPSIGKPLKHVLRGERSVRIGPYRLLYKVEADRLILLRFEHRGRVYKR